MLPHPVEHHRAAWEILHELMNSKPKDPGCLATPLTLSPHKVPGKGGSNPWTTGPLGRIPVLLRIPSPLLPSALPECGAKQEKFTRIKIQERRPNSLGGKTQKRC